MSGIYVSRYGQSGHTYAYGHVCPIVIENEALKFSNTQIVYNCSFLA